MADNITVVPWGLHPLANWVTTELKNRVKEYGQNPGLDPDKPYSGPRTAWARVFSNGISKHPEAAGKDGFVLGGVHGFNDSYGFNSNNKINIGVDAKGISHQIEFDRSNTIGLNNKKVTRADFPHRPPPSLESISCTLNGANSGFPNLCRKITINWKCYSLAQLNYMIPYFLTPRITCLVEWGWNNYDRESLVDLTDLDWINSMFTDPSYTTEYIELSKGNYDAGIGFITEYGYKMNEAGGYDCFTTILNANKLVEGEQIINKDVTVKQRNESLPVKSFYEFATKNLLSIDSDDPSYFYMRNRLKLEKNNDIKKRVFRISNKDSDLNKSKGLWLRMDLIQDIINAFFKIEMQSPKTAIIREFDIENTRMCANPFLKSINKNVLVPNQYAPRLIVEKDSNVSPSAVVEDGIYEKLFKERLEKIVQEYNISDKFDDLKEAINPYGQSFPIYKDEQFKDAKGNTTESVYSGYWGYLKDLFIDAEYFQGLVKNNDSVLKLIEQLLQGINESLCQVCQLKLIPAQYGNSKYSVMDENSPGISNANDASKLPMIVLGAIDSAFLKSVSFDIKTSAEMMNQLVMQSASPDKDPDGSTSTSITKSNPIVSRYSGGDRLYYKGEIKTIVEPLSGPALDAQAKKIADQQREQLKALEKKRASRNEKNFFIYYKKDQSNVTKKYFLYEPGKEFLNYILTQKNKKSPYLNNAIMPGTTLTIEFLGISGIDYLSQFVIDHAPEAYNYSNAVWQVSDITQTVEDKNWTTTIVAQVRPLTTL
jgi:hypothetical protein